MIIGVGSDLVRIARIEQTLARFGDRFIQRIFTPHEAAHCRNTRKPAACFAKRFAAKEALVKALGTGFRGGIWFQDIELFSDPHGAPHLRLTGETHRHLAPGAVCHVSLSDEGEYALAFVVIEQR